MFFGAADGTFVALMYSKSFGKIKSIKASTISSIKTIVKTDVSKISTAQIKLTVHK